MATVNKDFKIKHGLVVEGTTGTIDGNDILTKKQDDIDYIIDQVGGSGTSDNTPNTLVLRDENGDFAAGTVTANLSGNVTGQLYGNADTATALDGTLTIDVTGDASGFVEFDGSEGNVQLNVTLNTDFATDAEVSAAQTAAESYADTAVGTHSSATSGVHGVTGDVVGTTDTQTLTNKTLGSGTNLSVNLDMNGNKIEDLGTPTTGTDATTKDYVDAADTATLGSANSYTDGEITALDTSLKAYADQAEADAKTYTDTRETAITAAYQAYADQAETDANSYADGVALTAENNAKSYTDTRETAITAAYQSYADTAEADAISTAAAYTDQAEQDAIDAAATAAAALYAPLAGATFTGDVILNADPTQALGAATKQYVDGLSSGLTWKPAVNLFADSNIALTGTDGTLVIDDHAALDSNDVGYRILLTAQTTDSENGIYEYTVSGGNYTLVRASDADTFAELDGAALFIMEGTTYGATSWIQTNHYLSDFTGQTWVQFSGQGTYLAGTGLSLNGEVFSIDETYTATKSYVDGEIDTLDTDLRSYADQAEVDAKAYTDTREAAITTAYEAYADLAEADAKTYADGVAATAENNANSYTDGRETAITTAYQAYADLAEADAKTYADGAADDAEAAARAYTDTRETAITTAYQNYADLVDANVRVYVDQEISDLNTDDIEEGIVNQYFTTDRAEDAAGNLLANATLSNIQITYDSGTNALAITAENGVAGSTTDDLTEGNNNLYFTDARAQAAVAGDIATAIDALTTDDIEEGAANRYFSDALAQAAVAGDIASAVAAGDDTATPVYLAVNVADVAKQVAATVEAATAGMVTAYSWAKSSYRSAEFLVKTVNGTHTEISKILLTLDTSDNIAITEYAMIGTNGELATVSAAISGTNVEVQVTTNNDNSTVTVVGTLLV